MNVEQYKKRFYNLMESTMGDVKPLITESETNKLEGFKLVYAKFNPILSDPSADSNFQKFMNSQPIREWIPNGEIKISNGSETKGINKRNGTITSATAICQQGKGDSFDKACTVYFELKGDPTKYGCNFEKCWVQDSSGTPSPHSDVTAQK